MSHSSTRVSFLIAGAQKCGTTALDSYLRNHPQLEMPRVKEAHYFDCESGAVDWRSPSPAPLEDLFDGPVGRMRGEATPITLYWTPAYYRILRYNPEMRFIILLREPGARAYSHWRMNIARGLDQMGFSEAIRGGRLRVLEDPVQSGLARHSSYIERGYYGRQIEQLATLFPIETMLFLRQSDLLAAPDAVLAQVATFLGIDPFAPVVPRLLNTAEDDGDPLMSDEDRAYLSEIFASDLLRVKRLTGLDLPLEILP